MTKAEMVQAILAAGSACPELKAAAQSYLDAAGTPGETAAVQALIAECKEDVLKCADVVAFMQTDAAKAQLGEELAARILAHEQALLDSGAEYCDCTGCAAGKRVLDNQALFVE